MIPALMGKKKAVSLILGMHGDPHQEAPKDGGGSDVLLSIAKDIQRALESKSPEALAAGLKAFFAECDANEDSEPEEA